MVHNVKISSSNPPYIQWNIYTQTAQNPLWYIQLSDLTAQL